MRPGAIRCVGWVLALAAGCVSAPASAQVKAPPDTLEQRLKACSICHGEQGEGLLKNEYYPRLAGKPAGYLYNQLVNFREKRREFALMNYMIAHLSDTYLLEIADHYSKLNTPYPGPLKRAPADVLARGGKLANEGDPTRQIPACAECHGKTLTGVEPAIPGLIGLYGDYIAAQVGAWKNNQRHAMAPDCMHEVAQRLTPADIAAVTAWLVAQPIPANPRPALAGSVKPPLECGGITRK
ncbi:MAG TPA: c-type cytochrome [Burkholderiaceae bacterium]|nr:c-type cytochrome [Burkholderiaceae bacterium]